MVALAGLAEAVKEATGDVYLAGMWKKDLGSQLCCTAECWGGQRLRIPTDLAPTWSWVSVNGPVISDLRYYIPDSGDVACAEVLDVSVQSDHISQLHSFRSSKLVLRGPALFARALRTGHSRDESEDWMFQFTNLDESTRHCIAESVPVEIEWDENLPYRGANPERWASFIKERESNFLCMLVSLQVGLILRRLSDATDDDTYVRMGIFFDEDGKFFHILCARLNVPPKELLDEGIDLSDVRLTDAVHRVTIV